MAFRKGKDAPAHKHNPYGFFIWMAGGE